jgi:two-component system, chemotaxis family, chemotaxis protein CheY
MGKTVVLVGHCGPDSSFLRMAVSSAERGINVSMADDAQELKAALDGGVDLVLLNRELGWGFDTPLGVDVIKILRGSYPRTKWMLVSNYPDAQAAAVAAGAMPGFGKREIGQPRVAQLIRDALAASPAAAKSPATAATAS